MTVALHMGYTSSFCNWTLFLPVLNCKYLLQCRPEYKVPGLYVMDSIVRQSRHQFGSDKDVFAPRFTKNIVSTFQHLFKCPPEEKVCLIVFIFGVLALRVCNRPAKILCCVLLQQKIITLQIFIIKMWTRHQFTAKLSLCYNKIILSLLC